MEGQYLIWVMEDTGVKLTKIKQWWALTPKTQKGVLMGVLFLAVILMGFVILRPLYNAGTKKFIKAEGLRTEVRRLEQLSKTIDKQEKGTRAELKELERVIVQHNLQKSILPVFSTNFALKHEGIEFLGIKPGKQQKSKTVDDKKIPPYIPLEVIFRSDYPTIVEYLRYIESLNRPLKINTMNVAMDPDVDGLLRTTVGLHLYIHDVKAQPEAEEPPGEGSRTLAADTEAGELSFVPKGMEIETGGGFKDISFSLTGFIEDKALFGENLYEVGDTIQGWKFTEISSLEGKVVLTKGDKKKIISIGE